MTRWFSKTDEALVFLELSVQILHWPRHDSFADYVSIQNDIGQ
jgi:hypothetical protein